MEGPTNYCFWGYFWQLPYFICAFVWFCISESIDCTVLSPRGEAVVAIWGWLHPVCILHTGTVCPRTTLLPIPDTYPEIYICICICPYIGPYICLCLFHLSGESKISDIPIQYFSTGVHHPQFQKCHISWKFNQLVTKRSSFGRQGKLMKSKVAGICICILIYIFYRYLYFTLYFDLFDWYIIKRQTTEGKGLDSYMYLYLFLSWYLSSG